MALPVVFVRGVPAPTVLVRLVSELHAGQQIGRARCEFVDERLEGLDPELQQVGSCCTTVVLPKTSASGRGLGVGRLSLVGQRGVRCPTSRSSGHSDLGHRRRRASPARAGAQPGVDARQQPRMRCRPPGREHWMIINCRRGPGRSRFVEPTNRFRGAELLIFLRRDGHGKADIRRRRVGSCAPTRAHTAGSTAQIAASAHVLASPHAFVVQSAGQAVVDHRATQAHRLGGGDLPPGGPG